MIRAKRIDPMIQRVIGWSWRFPPRRGDLVVIDNDLWRVARCRVSWDGPRWMIRDLRAKPIKGRP